MSKLRFDQLLARFYPELSRNKIQTLIEKGCVDIFYCKQWKTERKPGSKYDEANWLSEHFRVRFDQELKYVSRGALKLKQAIEEFSITVYKAVCLDVGLSTGGFSDYLLQSGAKRVLGIDVGREQLHPSLRQNPRLIFHDKINARNPLSQEILVDFFDTAPQLFDLIVVDVSFISLAKIIPNLHGLLRPGGTLVTLLKPQFELQKEDLNKKGVVKDLARVEHAKQKIFEVIGDCKLEIIGQCPSPIEGENGNQEYLIISRQH